MMDYTELIERLNTVPVGHAGLLTQASNAIEALQARVTELEGQVSVGWLISYEYLASTENIDGSLKKFKENWIESSFLSEFKDANIDAGSSQGRRMTYKIGDRIRMTTLVWGEQITDRKGNPIHQSPYKEVYEGVVKFVGPEGAFKGAVEVVRCTGGNKALKLNNGFSFYPKDNGPEQIVEVLNKAIAAKGGAV